MKGSECRILFQNWQIHVLFPCLLTMLQSCLNEKSLLLSSERQSLKWNSPWCGLFGSFNSKEYIWTLYILYYTLCIWIFCQRMWKRCCPWNPTEGEAGDGGVASPHGWVEAPGSLTSSMLYEGGLLRWKSGFSPCGLWSCQGHCTHRGLLPPSLWLSIEINKKKKPHMMGE